MTIIQSHMINDTSFCVLICDKDEIKFYLQEKGLSDKEAEKMAMELVESDQFRKKFTDALMVDFHEKLEYLVGEQT